MEILINKSFYSKRSKTKIYAILSIKEGKNPADPIIHYEIQEGGVKKKGWVLLSKIKKKWFETSTGKSLEELLEEERK